MYQKVTVSCKIRSANINLVTAVEVCVDSSPRLSVTELTGGSWDRSTLTTVRWSTSDDLPSILRGCVDVDLSSVSWGCTYATAPPSTVSCSGIFLDRTNALRLPVNQSIKCISKSSACMTKKTHIKRQEAQLSLEYPTVLVVSDF